MRVVSKHNHGDRFLPVVASQNFCLTELLVFISFKVNPLKVDIVVGKELLGSHTVSAPIGAIHRDCHNRQFRDFKSLGFCAQPTDTYIYVSDRCCRVPGSLVLVAIGGFNGRAQKQFFGANQHSDPEIDSCLKMLVGNAAFKDDELFYFNYLAVVFVVAVF